MRTKFKISENRTQRIIYGRSDLYSYRVRLKCVSHLTKIGEAQNEKTQNRKRQDLDVVEKIVGHT